MKKKHNIVYADLSIFKNVYINIVWLNDSTNQNYILYIPLPSAQGCSVFDKNI